MILPMTNGLGQPPPQSAGLTELITERLLGLMGSGYLKEGSKLPPERELAQLLGVSRTVVREALSALRLAGLVERRPGRGTVITRVPASTFDLSSQIEAGVSLAELIDARLTVDLGIVHLLCDQRRHDLREVAAIFDVMRVAVRSERNVAAYMMPSLDFHLALARATERPLVAAIQERLVELTRPHAWLVAEKYDLRLAEESLALHERIFAAIRARDVVSALAYVKSHYVSYPILTRSEASPGETEGRREASPSLRLTT